MATPALVSPPANVMDSITPKSIKAPGHVLELLRRLHRKSLDQEAEIKASGAVEEIKSHASGDPKERKQLIDNLMRDKFIALVPDKAVYMYNMVRASRALHVVECGTSYGVSTIYLALAVGQNAAIAGKKPGSARVIATENEAAKAAQARAHWKEAGDSVMPWIDIREGDILETLQHDVADVDFVLFDIWSPMALPILKTLEPKLRNGAMLLTDNTISAAEGYAEFLSYIKADGSPYTTMTLPFEDGLELTLYSPNLVAV
ncbi:Catechol O-methyltransferase A [Pseudocercospora fuligena]|uniref:Catechol O-methyltransferase A n=1 Tax=Pseudocercospora fuligena TaxID=685502 RepID=A0A8H6RLP2_9PEZI|nr:Catechol O-methyltransferase A [Pseudocercospora fuligena]